MSAETVMEMQLSTRDYNNPRILTFRDKGGNTIYVDYDSDGVIELQGLNHLHPKSRSKSHTISAQRRAAIVKEENYVKEIHLHLPRDDGNNEERTQGILCQDENTSSSESTTYHD